MSKIFRLMLLIGGFFCASLPGRANADFVIDIVRVGSGDVLPNSTVSFDVFLSSPAGTPENLLSGFGLFFDLSPISGKGLPVGLGSVTAQDYVFSQNQNIDLSLANAFATTNFDFVVGADSTTSVVVPVSPASPLKLFRLNLGVGSISAGTYSLRFIDDPIGDGSSLRDGFPPLVGLGDFGRLSASSNFSASFQSVPEPGSICLVTTILGGLALNRRVRRQKLK